MEKTAAFLTHELRAPLTAILCALELMKEETEASGEGKGPMLEAALRNARRLNALIDDVMDSSKIQAGRMRMKPRPCDPLEIVRETAVSMRPWAARQKISLIVNGDRDLPPVLTDCRRTVQAMTNLVSNALKFTPEGGSITIKIERGAREFAGSVLFSVTDTGPGLSPEEAKSVFRYFVQGEKGAEREDGTGLGLPLARSFVEMLGGMMWAESAPGRGATFRFTLPQALPDAKKATADAARRVPASSAVPANTTDRP
jgi:signal transduction histidine kinase